MKCKIPEISWHNRDPVLSVDIQPKVNDSNYYRLASGGTDAHVLIWYMKLTSSGVYGDIELDLAVDLARHQRAVNVVKWSPSGELLASGDDECVIFIWKQKSDNEPVNILDPANEQDKETWVTLKVLRGHMEDIYDLSWAPNSLFLVSGSVDNSAMIWDVQKGKSISILNDHKGFVQGVAWDPKNQYIATLSTDRYLRIFDIHTRKTLYRISKGILPFPEDNILHGKRMRLFHDDTLQTFFRRLSFTPDGKLLLTPAGVTDYEGCTRPLNTTYIFSRHGFRQPAIVLPCPDQYTVAVKCCPLLYKLRSFNAEKNPPVVPLPYRMIFAVATKSSVYFYDTQQKQPFALISNIHYTRLTDITWSSDGLIVVVSSTDGFCSLITFEKGELGEEYENSEAVLEAPLAQVTKKTKKQKENETIAKSRKSSTDDTVIVQKQRELEKNIEQNEEKTPLELKSSNEIKTNDPIKLNNISTKANNLDKLEKKSTLLEIKRKCDKHEKTKVCAEPGITSTESNYTEKEAHYVHDKQKEDKKPTHISIERRSRTPETEFKVGYGESRPKPTVMKTRPEVIAESTKNKSEEKLESKTTPIGIKRKPETLANNDEIFFNSTKCIEETPPKKVAIIPSKVLAAEIIIDKEILSSDEKFEVPEKKSRPVTPITVRRHPRSTYSLPKTPTSMSNVLNSQAESNNQSPISSLSKENPTTFQDKKAKPIAVRRTPRANISSPSVVNTTSLVEEAMDAWPLERDSNSDIRKESLTEIVKEPIKEAGITPLPISETTCERTEDIRLIYEETNEEAPVKESLPKPLKETFPELAKISVDKTKPQTPIGNKTPRRVALRTISTPKSKKKLLDY